MTDVEIREEIPDDSAICKDTQLRYRIFKKNSPYLYDYLTTNSLLWPSLTVQFFPDLEQDSAGGPEIAISELETAVGELEPARSRQIASQLAFQRLLLGTFTLGQAVDSFSIYQLPYYRNLNKCINMDQWNFNPDKEEFELSTVVKTSLRTVQTINHAGDVNKLRYMPQNPDIIASANNVGSLLVYNRTKHLNIKTLTGESEINEPQLRLEDQNLDVSEVADIFAFDWNRHKEGIIVSGSMSGSINIYDIQSGFKSSNTNVVNHYWTYQCPSGVNDLEWVPGHDSVVVSAEDDGSICVYDVRVSSQKTLGYKSQYAVNSVSVNPGNTFCVASGHSNGGLGIYDLRNLDGSVFDSVPHLDSITQVKWHPTFYGVVGTSSADRLVKLHDMSSDNKLLFDHQGHMLGVNDFDWSLHEDWMVASVADDNSLHVWKPSSHLLTRFR